MTNVFNRRISTSRGDSLVVVVDYQIRNTGTVVVPGYQVVFRIVTPAGDFFQQVDQTVPLAIGQSRVGRIEEDAGGSEDAERARPPTRRAVRDHELAETFITGQSRPAARPQPSR